MSYYNGVHCPAGTVLNGVATGSLDKFVCSAILQGWPRGIYDTEAVRGKEVQCPVG